MGFPIERTQLHSNATTAVNGTDVDGQGHLLHRFRIRCAGGTATIAIETSDDSSNFDLAASVDLTADTNEIREVTGPHQRLRARISAISGATVNVILEQCYHSPGAAL